MSSDSEKTACSKCALEYPGDALFCPNCGTSRAADDASTSIVGSTVGDRYMLLKQIGQGTSGTIYKAEHVTLRRRVAVKVLHHELSKDDLAIERFRREATTVAELDNDHIVEIYDFGRTSDGRLYLAMELLDGQTLSDLLEDRRLTVEETVDILVQLAETLMEAHAMGYIHRDLRPPNVYLVNRRGRERFVKLLDFGLAKLVAPEEGEAASTSLGMTFGDPHYMSPEQARGEGFDRRVDIYALGCIGFEMLIGEPPFSGGKVFEILTQQVDTPPREPISLRPGIPAWLNKAIMRMLAKKPEDRFITVYRLAEALRQGTDSGVIMTDERARKKETDPPPSVSAAMARLAARASEEELDAQHAAPQQAAKSNQQRETGAETVLGLGMAGAEAVDDGPTEPSAMSPEEPEEPTPIPGAFKAPRPHRSTGRHTAGGPGSGPMRAHIGRASSEQKAVQSPSAPSSSRSSSDSSASSRSRRDSSGSSRDPSASTSSRGMRPFGKKRTRRASASQSGSGMSAAWYADGDALSEREQTPSRTDMLGATNDYYLPDGSGRGRKIALGAGGFVVLLIAAVFLWPSGGSGDKSKGAATVTFDAALVAAPRYDAAPVISDDAVAVVAAPVDAGKVATNNGNSHTKPPRDPPPRDPPPRDPPPRDPPPRDPPPRDPPPDDPPPDDGPSLEDKKKAEFYAKLGNNLLRSGDILGAATNFRKASKLDSGNVRAIIGQGEIALSQGGYAMAIKHLSRAAKRSRGAKVQTLLGEAYLGAGNNAKAKSAFKRALKINPDSSRARDGYNEATGQGG